ncbi:MAG TPA: DNRLRE domain-containing protein, partial [Candidatus Dormibacteraeota bacterium]|nr:DNRLRE domain-containing protein [Candidatus Dormibacteraeota bacterium]
MRPQSDLSAATTTTALPIADTYITQQQPTLNSGTSTQLRVDGSPVLRTYLKFDLGAISGTVQQATLRIFAETSQSTGFAARAAGSGWTETGLNATNQPTLGASVGS